MPSITWLDRGVKALRALVSRTQRMHRTPFAVALVAAAVVLAWALDLDFGVDQRVREVEEIPTADSGASYEYTMDTAELEILEYGFGRVAVDGGDRIILGVVVRNPYGQGLYPGTLSVTATAEDGHPIRAHDFHIDAIAPESTVRVGHVLPLDATDVRLEELRVESLGSAYLLPEREDVPGDMPAEYFEPLPAPPEVTVAGVEPLASPAGFRLHYELSAQTERMRLSVLFRDGEGNLIGGLPAGPDPFAPNGSEGWRSFPIGESAQYTDLLEAWIPEGADLDRIEISPAGATG